MYDNEFYALSFDPKNRQINWTIKGPWLSSKAVPDVLNQWDAILSQVMTPGFKVLANMTNLRAEPHDVEMLHMQIQQKIMAAGVRKVATVISKSAVAGLAGKRVGRETGVAEVARNFGSTAEAQAWLDE